MKHKIEAFDLDANVKNFVFRCNKEKCSEHAVLDFITLQVEGRTWKQARQRLNKFLEVIR